jgi:hypothetical protein
MSGNAGGSALGIDGLSWGDVLNYGSRLVGTGLNSRNQGDANELSREQLAQALRLGTIDQETPYGNVDFTINPDGSISRRVTLNERDQQNLESRRDIQQDVAGMMQKPMEDNVTRFLPPAYGGSALGYQYSTGPRGR